MPRSHVKPAETPHVLVIDVGGSNIKLSVTGDDRVQKIKSGRSLNPKKALTLIEEATKGMTYDAIALGLPTPVKNGLPTAEPTNLGRGWVGFDFSKHIDRPIRVINDAALQALGSWESGRMLFLGLGTGLGSAMIMEGLVIPLELCELRITRTKSLESVVSKEALKRIGQVRWQKEVIQALSLLKTALLPDTIVLGGGNAKFVKNLPAGVLSGQNRKVQRGGERLWEMRIGLDGKAEFCWRIE